MRCTAILCALLTLSGVHGGWCFPLAREGKPAAAIITDANPAPQEREAAFALLRGIALMTGAELPILQTDRPAAQPGIYIGRAWADRFTQSLSRNAVVRRLDWAALADGGAWYTEGDRFVIAGPTPEGTLLTCYGLLRQWGCRWALPGVTKPVYPQRSELDTPEDRNLVPAMRHSSVLPGKELARELREQLRQWALFNGVPYHEDVSEIRDGEVVEEPTDRCPLHRLGFPGCEQNDRSVTFGGPDGRTIVLIHFQKDPLLERLPLDFNEEIENYLKVGASDFAVEVHHFNLIFLPGLAAAVARVEEGKANPGDRVHTATDAAYHGIQDEVDAFYDLLREAYRGYHQRLDRQEPLFAGDTTRPADEIMAGIVARAQTTGIDAPAQLLATAWFAEQRAVAARAAAGTPAAKRLAADALQYLKQVDTPDFRAAFPVAAVEAELVTE